MPLLELAHKFGVTTLKEECGLMLFNSAEVKNVSFFLDIAHKYSCSLLETCCANYMVFLSFITNFSRVKRSNRQQSFKS